MDLHLTSKQYRRLLDMVYIGNWVLNSAREDDRFEDYDEVESLLFSKAEEAGMPTLAEPWLNQIVPSQAFVNGGIHDAIEDYEDAVFFDILAEDLARRDMNDPLIDETNLPELAQRMEDYRAEFEAHGTDRLRVDGDLT